MKYLGMVVNSDLSFLKSYLYQYIALGPKLINKNNFKKIIKGKINKQKTQLLLKVKLD